MGEAPCCSSSAETGPLTRSGARAASTLLSSVALTTLIATARWFAGVACELLSLPNALYAPNPRPPSAMMSRRRPIRRQGRLRLGRSRSRR